MTILNKILKSISQYQISQYRLILYTAIFFVIFDNISFFQNVLEVYPLEGMNIVFNISIFLTLIIFIVLLFSLFSSKYTTKPLLIIAVMVSSFTNYFMNTYHVIIDHAMIRNSLQTNLNESLDLFSITLVLYVIFLGLIPSYLIYKVKIKYNPIKKEIKEKLKTIVVSIVLIVILILSLSNYYTSFFREHKQLRYYANPTYWIYGIRTYIKRTYFNGPIVLKQIGTDAKIYNSKHNKIVIMVVGEAARADHFSLNGYEKETNPLLINDDIINLSNVSSCGTATAQSVPCMFSIFDRANYNYNKGITNENVLDVLKHTKQVNILWRDNNSDSKGVALRVPYEDFKYPSINTICPEGECRDEGMLIGLDKHIEKNKDKDILIVLHQMGNHGPAYYKRYTKEFEKFKPVCKTNQLEECTKETIANGYDNAILYTDYFLDKTIKFLKQYDKTHETALIYMSDHGESLGENGIYLHGLPYFMAPEAQTHVGALVWFGDKMKENIDIEKLTKNKDNDYSQDNLFHTLLGIFNVETKVYNNKMDILK